MKKSFTFIAHLFRRPPKAVPNVSGQSQRLGKVMAQDRKSDPRIFIDMGPQYLARLSLRTPPVCIDINFFWQRKPEQSFKGILIKKKRSVQR